MRSIIWWYHWVFNRVCIRHCCRLKVKLSHNDTVWYCAGCEEDMKQYEKEVKQQVHEHQQKIIDKYCRGK